MVSIKKRGRKKGSVLISVVVLTGIIIILSTYLIEKNECLLNYFRNSNEYIITQTDEEEAKEIILSMLYKKLQQSTETDFEVKYENSIGRYLKKKEVIVVNFRNSFKIEKIYHYKVMKNGSHIYFENIKNYNVND